MMLHNPQELSLFPRLSDADIEVFSERGDQRHFSPGETIFLEEQSDYDLWIVLEGKVEVTRRIAGEDVVLAIHGAGEFTGEISLLTCQKSKVTGKAVGAVRCLQVSAQVVRQSIAACSPLATRLLEAMAGRSRDAEVQLRQQEKLAALGKLSAGLAHELNNPVAAISRASASLQAAIGEMESLIAMTGGAPDAEHWQALAAVREWLGEARQHAQAVDTFESMRREEALADWLDSRDIPNSWLIAPVLSRAGLDVDTLEPMVREWRGKALNFALAWTEMLLRLQGFGLEIVNSAGRMSHVVGTMKQYTQMDRAPLQEIAVHEGIDVTLAIFERRLERGVSVIREYDPHLPRIHAFAGELNQMWTSLIDNALEAMPSGGELKVRTETCDQHISVEIHDTGVGIPPENLPRVFEPFFTTKPVGEGLGLGLDNVQRVVHHHRGWIHISSEPGSTSVSVNLPI